MSDRFVVWTPWPGREAYVLDEQRCGCPECSNIVAGATPARASRLAARLNARVALGHPVEFDREWYHRARDGR